MGFILYPDPRLMRKAALADGVDARLRAIGAELAGACAAARAYGLAAAHIGHVAPIVVVNLTPDAPARDDALLFNPRVLTSGGAVTSGPEASVSMPGVEIAVDRPAWAEIGFDDPDGVAQMRRFEGFAARVVLHEIEQMNGIFFLSHVSRLKRDMLVRKFVKAQKLAGAAG